MSKLSSFKFAFRGLREVFRTERNAKIHAFFALCALIAGLIFRVSIASWTALVVVATLVFFAEITNTAVERTLDMISQENHQLVRKIKDTTAAGVLVTAFAAVAVAILVFLPPIIKITMAWVE